MSPAMQLKLTAFMYITCKPDDSAETIIFIPSLYGGELTSYETRLTALQTRHNTTTIPCLPQPTFPTSNVFSRLSFNRVDLSAPARTCQL